MSGKRAKQKRKEELQNLRLWHYTTDHHFGKISSSGAIMPTSVNIEKNEKPAVWLSSNPDWEKTVTKVLSYNDGTVSEPLGRDELLKFGIIPIRIEIDLNAVKVISWNKFKNSSGISQKMAASLEKVGIEQGADPLEWYASYEIISAYKWKSIDFWAGTEWVQYNMKEIENEI